MLHPDRQCVACAEVSHRIFILIAIITDVEVPHPKALEPVLHTINRLVLFLFDYSVYSLMCEREYECVTVFFVCRRLCLPVLATCHKTPGDCREPAEHTAVFAFDNGEGGGDTVTEFVEEGG